MCCFDMGLPKTQVVQLCEAGYLPLRDLQCKLVNTAQVPISHHSKPRMLPTLNSS